MSCPDISFEIKQQDMNDREKYTANTNLRVAKWCKRPGGTMFGLDSSGNCLNEEYCNSFEILGKSLVNLPGNIIGKATGVAAGVASAATIGLVDELDKNKSIGQGIKNAAINGYYTGEDLREALTVQNAWGKKIKKSKKGKKSKAKKKGKKSMVKKLKW